MRTVLDARLRDDMQAKHYEPGGKYHLFGNARGSVKNRVYAVQTFDATAVGPHTAYYTRTDRI